MWQIMCGYIIVVKLVAKIKLSCKCYTDGQRLNMYMLTVFIIHGPFSDVMLNHNLLLDVRCDFIYATKRTLVGNVGCNYFMVTNWHFSSSATSFVSTYTPPYIPRTYICTNVLIYNLQPTYVVGPTYLPTWVPIRTCM